VNVRVSVGIAGGQGQGLRADTLVRDADAAMYSAKSLGRNQTYVFAEPEDDAGVLRAPISPVGRARAEEIGRAARETVLSSLTAVIADLPGDRGRPSTVAVAIATTMATALELPDAEVERIRVASLLRDIGKVAVPYEVLAKSSALTSSEWRAIVQHPRIAQVILEQATALREAVPLILHHHERFAGHGYPFGLRGDEIPLGARIVAIADAYDAMTHDRPYKRAMVHEAAIRELRRHAGTQFDPALVRLFCDLFSLSVPGADDPESTRLLTGMPEAPMAHPELPRPAHDLRQVATIRSRPAPTPTRRLSAGSRATSGTRPPASAAVSPTGSGRPQPRKSSESAAASAVDRPRPGIPTRPTRPTRRPGPLAAPAPAGDMNGSALPATPAEPAPAGRPTTDRPVAAATAKGGPAAPGRRRTQDAPERAAG
jgi:hypothetical protein